MIRWLAPLLLAGCATTADLPHDGGATDDALTGSSGGRFDRGSGVPPPLDWGGVPPPPPPPGRDAQVQPPPPPRQDAARPPPGCQPGQVLDDLCTQCGPDGRPTLMEDDDRCPEVDCGGLDLYERAMEGDAVVCVQIRHRPVGGRCVAARTCRERADAAYCSDVVRVELQRVEQMCRTIAGCQGADPPREEAAPVGTACEGGVCDANGACDEEVAEDCDDFTADAACSTGVHNDGTPYCELAVAAPTSCNAVCMAARSRCLRAWVAAAGQPCVADREIGCLEQQGGVLCRCAQP